MEYYAERGSPFYLIDILMRTLESLEPLETLVSIFARPCGIW